MVKKKSPVLLIVFSGGLYLLIVFLMYFFERNISSSNIQSFGDSFWCSITTLTTVGYGDKFPVTFFGRILSLFFIVGSVGLISFFVGSVSEFIREYKEMQKKGRNGTDFSNHVIVIGWDDFARSVVEQLIAAKRKVAVVTNQSEQIDLIYDYFEKEDCFVYCGDWQNSKSMQGVQVAEAHSIFVNIPDDSQRLIAVLNLKREWPNAAFIVTLDNASLKNTYYSAGVTYVLSKDEIASKLLASCIFEPDVAQMTQDLLSAATCEDDYDIQQYRILPQNQLVGKTYGEAVSCLNDQCRMVLLGMSKTNKNASDRKLLMLPDNNTLIDVGDFLIGVIGGGTLERAQNFFGIDDGDL